MRSGKELRVRRAVSPPCRSHPPKPCLLLPRSKSARNLTSLSSPIRLWERWDSATILNRICFRRRRSRSRVVAHYKILRRVPSSHRTVAICRWWKRLVASVTPSSLGKWFHIVSSRPRKRWNHPHPPSNSKASLIRCTECDHHKISKPRIIAPASANKIRVPS